jgi:hypothetical protein
MLQLVRPVDIVLGNLSDYIGGDYAMHAFIVACQTGGFDGLTGGTERCEHVNCIKLAL